MILNTQIEQLRLETAHLRSAKTKNPIKSLLFIVSFVLALLRSCRMETLFLLLDY